MRKLPLIHANIINLLGIGALPLEKKLEVKRNAEDLVETRVLARILEELPTDKREEFGKLLEEEDMAGVEEFMATHNIDMMNIIEEEVEKAKQELLGDIESDEGLK